MRWLIIIFSLIFIVCLGITVWGYNQFIKPGQLEIKKNVIIPRGIGIERIAILLGRYNVIKIPLILSIAARTIGANNKLQAGEFSFPKHVSPREVLFILQQGKQVVRRFTVAEGLSNKQVHELLNATDGLIGEVIMPLNEGELLPETYYFSYGDSKNALIKRMREGMRNILEDLWQKRSRNLPITNVKEALILASIVEKETGRSAERGRIAGVFINRLRLNMKLQSDPTVIFSITKGHRELQRVLSREDLKVRSPYNTYHIRGLPPEAISNPGRAAIRAVMNPVKTDELYFVADGKGGHAFAKNLAEHNKNVAKWRKIVK
jgi:UPF0755 protein